MIEYKMSKNLSKKLLKSRKEKNELKMRPQEFLCHYVNTQLGIKGVCTRVIVI